MTLSPEHWRCPLIRPRTFERRRVVARLALHAEATSMNVRTCVAGAADHRRLDDVLRSDMAVGATCLCVGTQQREARVSCMVEVPHLPAVRRMALVAVLAEPSVVNIIL